jgi:integrase
MVQPSGGKLWRYKYLFNGVEKKISLGIYPDVSLQVARKRHQEAREQLAQGIDPSAARKAMKVASGEMAANSFEVIAREWFENWRKDKTESHAARTIVNLEKDAFPYIGSMPIALIKAPDVLATCRRIEKRGAVETAHRVRTTISQVMRYAVITDRAVRDPCPDLRGALQSVRAQPLPSITEPSEITGLLQAIDEYKGTFVVKSALLLAPLVFVRPGELRNAKWADIDIESAEWTFQYLKQRTNIGDKRKLIVPLSRQAVAILKNLHPVTGGGVYVFPGLRPGRPISDGTINKALRTMGYDTRTEITAHGFRAMARTVIAERLHIDTQWIERQLSHRTSEKLGEAYDRAQYLDDRRNMMQTWADYLDGLKAGKVKQRKAG